MNLRPNNDWLNMFPPSDEDGGTGTFSVVRPTPGPLSDQIYPDYVPEDPNFELASICR